MPNIQSAEKRPQQIQVRRKKTRHQAIDSHRVKKVLEAVKSGNVEQAESELRVAAKKVEQSRHQEDHPPQCGRPREIAALGEGEKLEGQ